ncbi:MAG TPA: hypothetical protein VFO25_02665 [Candidatus Eremiobacteraceae bacterium]|nr:hypothetical protein [Candidatus Eremiobacteraceae bacterium]
MRSRIEVSADHDGLLRAVRSVRIAEKRNSTNQRLRQESGCFFGLCDEEMKIRRIDPHQPRWAQRASRDERLGAEYDGELPKEFRRVKRR